VVAPLLSKKGTNAMKPYTHLICAEEAARNVLHKLSILRLSIPEEHLPFLDKLSRGTSDILEDLDELKVNPVIAAVTLTDREHYLVSYALIMFTQHIRARTGQKVGDESTGVLAEVENLRLRMPCAKNTDSEGRELWTDIIDEVETPH